MTIDILNRPEYENRCIEFDSTEETILFSFDEKLLIRAFQNLIVNAFVHGDKDTEITMQISTSVHEINITLSDNGKGMTEKETEKVI